MDRFISDVDLQNLLTEDYIEIDMNIIKDEDKVFLIIDKDTGRAYDIRNERHVERLTESEITKSSLSSSKSTSINDNYVPGFKKSDDTN